MAEDLTPLRRRRTPGKPRTVDTPLSYREQLFAEHYALNGGNGAEAARHAGYSERSARVYAVHLLAYVNVAAAIEKARARRLERMNLTKEKVIASLAELVTEPLPDLGGFIDAAGNVKAFTELTREQLAMIQSIEFVRRNPVTGGNLKTGQQEMDTVVKVRLWNVRGSRAKALELSMRYYGLDKGEGDGTDKHPEVPVFALPADSIEGPAVH